MELLRYKRLLLSKRDELSAAQNERGTLVPSAGGRSGDIIDCASADMEAELQISLRRSDGHLVKAIDDALARIRAETFGVCEVCKHPISKARLEAVPWTRHCRDCKE